MKKTILAITLFFAFISISFAAVNLNTATQEQLEAIKGIGPTKAQAIIDYRHKNGNFKTVDDLKNIKGFGDKSVDNLRSELTVGDDVSKKPQADKK